MFRVNKRNMHLFLIAYYATMKAKKKGNLLKPLLVK